jgi:hypothetical protein
MSYMHINNLYKDKSILLFKECYALEKIHGTSAHISFSPGNISLIDGHIDGAEIKFFSGGMSHELFLSLFDKDDLLQKFALIGTKQKAVIYGEAYGGKMQGMKEVYGPDAKFVVFEVKIGDYWLKVPDAEDVTNKLGLEFVHYDRIPCTIEALDAERDKDSVQAFRNGMGWGKKREGIVLRPLIEVTTNDGSRIIAKHKGEAFRETYTARRLDVDPQVLADAESIAEEWVTPMRLRHVLDAVHVKLGRGVGIEDTGMVIEMMVSDVLREAEGEIVDDRTVRKTLGSYAARMFKFFLKMESESLAHWRR